MKMLYKIEKFFRKIDDIFPDPWIVDGNVQARPVTQLGMISGFIIGIIIYLILF